MPELRRFSGALDRVERSKLLDSQTLIDEVGEPVVSVSGGPKDVRVLDDLMSDLDARINNEEWAEDRATSDRWLAPRLHWALRLARSEAADRGTWLWLAMRYPDYLRWRWASDVDEIAEDRWFGPIHKHALARLWWGSELFRNGSDYRPVQRAFIRQDLPNSYLHRPLVRCRSLALGLLDVVAPETDEGSKSAREVNDLARVLNLATGGSPPELETDFQQDDRVGYLAWIADDSLVPEDWDRLPIGPDTQDTTQASREGGTAIAIRGWDFALRARAKEG